METWKPLTDPRVEEKRRDVCCGGIKQVIKCGGEGRRRTPRSLLEREGAPFRVTGKIKGGKALCFVSLRNSIQEFHRGHKLSLRELQGIQEEKSSWPGAWSAENPAGLKI